jgi:hypothetical protein
LSRVFPAVIVLLALVLLPVIPAQADDSGTVVSIPDATVGPGEEVTLPINITNITDVGAITIWLCYDPTIVTIPAGGIADGNMGALWSYSIDNITGEARMTWVDPYGKNGTFVFAYVTLKAGSVSGSSPLDIQVKDLADSNGTDIAHTVNDGTFTVMEGNATLEGNVSFTGRGTAPNDKWAEPFMVKGFEPGNLSHVLWTTNATTNDTGVFTIEGVTPGTYNVSIKNWTCLSEVVTGVTLTAGNTTVVNFGTTREGDCDNNDHINILDASFLASRFGSGEGDPGWSPLCDFNRDTNINILDASALASNFGQGGDLVS